MSEKKKFAGDFYQTESVEPTPAECPNCMYPNKSVEKEPAECPNCYYIPQKKEGEAEAQKEQEDKK